MKGGLSSYQPVSGVSCLLTSQVGGATASSSTLQVEELVPDMLSPLPCSKGAQKKIAQANMEKLEENSKKKGSKKEKKDKKEKAKNPAPKKSCKACFKDEKSSEKNEEVETKVSENGEKSDMSAEGDMGAIDKDDMIAKGAEKKEGVTGKRKRRFTEEEKQKALSSIGVHPQGSFGFPGS